MTIGRKIIALHQAQQALVSSLVSRTQHYAVDFFLRHEKPDTSNASRQIMKKCLVRRNAK